MPVPSESHTLSRPVDRPETASAVVGRVKPAFRVRTDPRQVDCYDLRKAPAVALEKAGLKPGIYWLPRPYEMPAVPGVNGVWCDVDAGWKTEDVLTKGYPTLTEEERAAGGITIPPSAVSRSLTPARMPRRFTIGLCRAAGSPG